jgi:hypothetical protein
MRVKSQKFGYANVRTNRGLSEISQFAPVLYITFLIALMPLLDLVCVFVAGTTQYLATNDFVAKAATQADYSSALNTMVNEAYQFQSTGLAKFLNMLPNGGYTGCGDDLYVLATDIGSGQVKSSGANKPLSQKINTQTSMYELLVKSTYEVSPLVSLSAVPVLCNVPGLGKPVTLAFTASRPVEHPGGLQAGPSGMVVAGTVSPFPRVASNPGNTPPPTSDTWRTPDIFQQIQKAGESVVSVNVVSVPAKQAFLGQLTSTGLNILPGQKIWIDTQSVGIWQTAPSYGNADANGYAGMFFGDAVSPRLTYGALLGQIGTNGSPFFLGDDKLNYPPVGAGTIFLTMNQCSNQYMNGVGYQMVRVIVVQ